MNVQLFTGQGRNGATVRLPHEYRRNVKWLPQIGDIFPDFKTPTTQGPLRFYDWAEGHWSVLFSHPAACTPVCTTELAALCDALPDFEARNTRLLGVTSSPLSDQALWHREIEEMFGVEVGFPCIDDTCGYLGRLFGMIHPKEATAFPVRKNYVLDPSMRIRMIMEYPLYIGRSTDELLRVIDALQAHDRHEVAVPADWKRGDMLVLPAPQTDAECLRRYGACPERLSPYLHTIDIAS